jgi:hypothetical protein
MRVSEKMNNISIDERKLGKHMVEIVFSEELKDLTTNEIKAVAFLMEYAVQKSKIDDQPSNGYKTRE